MTSPEARLVELGIELPAASTPAGSYVNALTAGEFVYVAGHGPLRDGLPAYRGRVPDQVSLEDAKHAARLTMMGCLATLRAHLGSLDDVVQIVRVLGMVRAADGFEQHPYVINGASELLVEVFGDLSAHTRSAVGMSSLPFGIPVEIEMTVRIAR